MDGIQHILLSYAKEMKEPLYIFWYSYFPLFSQGTSMQQMSYFANACYFSDLHSAQILGEVIAQ